ncbi:hypothetical protein BGW80DRAFT_595558 [Lactifluus volemus]|nr:hypothetical protein BGW80DRAFT_595558 [Lactifluus volemus]
MSFSDFYASDLTDITSSSEEEEQPYLPKVKKLSVKKPKIDHWSAYNVTNPLRPPRSTNYSVRSLYEQIIDGTIDLDPDYQRDVVWSEQKQIGLIDSVFRNYYIPPIIFAVSTSKDGSESRVCIDGKQRLTSIQKFLDGLIPHRDHITGKRYWCKKQGANSRALLPKALQQAFANKQIVCVEYDSLTDEQEREIFQRVQLGVALTPAERMQAITGPWPNFIREIQSQVLGDDGFGNSFDWGRARGRDFHGLASIVYMIDQLPACRIPPTSQAMDRWLTRTTPVSPKLRSGVLDTFRVYLSLAREKIYRKPFSQRVSPIEFVMIGVMIYMKRETLSLSQLSHAVEKMRADIRLTEKDVRSNGRVTKLLFKFISEKLPKLTLRSDGKGDKSAQSTLSSLPRAPASVPAPAAKSNKLGSTTTSAAVRVSAPKKRKRQVEVEENGNETNNSSDAEGTDEEEYIPKPKRRPVGRPPAAKVLQSSAKTERVRSPPDQLPPISSLPPPPPALPAPMPASAPAHITTFTLKSKRQEVVQAELEEGEEREGEIVSPVTPSTPTPSLTPVASTTTSRAETHSTPANPPPPPLSTPQIKFEPGAVLVPFRTPMDRLAALRAARSRPIASPTPPLPGPALVDEPSPAATMAAPIDLGALDQLQRLLTLSAGLVDGALSNAASATQLPAQQQQQQEQHQEEDSANSNTILALEQLRAILSLPPPPPQQQQQQQLQVQQAQYPPTTTTATSTTVAIPIPTQTPTIKAEQNEPSLSSNSHVPPPSMIKTSPGLSSTSSRGRRPYRSSYGYRSPSPSRDYDYHRHGPPPPLGPRHKYDDYDYHYHRRRRGRSRSYSSRSRSRSRSHPRSRSRSRSRSPPPPRSRIHPNRLVSRSRSWDRDRDRERSGGGGGGGGGGLRRRRSSPGIPHAPRKFDFTHDRVRRNREYQEYLRERRASGGGPPGGGSANGGGGGSASASAGGGGGVGGGPSGPGSWSMSGTF